MILRTGFYVGDEQHKFWHLLVPLVPPTLQVTWITRHRSGPPTSVSRAFRTPAAIPTLPQITSASSPSCFLSRIRFLCMCVLYAALR